MNVTAAGKVKLLCILRKCTKIKYITLLSDAGKLPKNLL